MTWQNLADDLADEFGAYEPPPVHEQLAGYVAVMRARQAERRRAAPSTAPALVRKYNATHREYKRQWQNAKRAAQRLANPPRKPGRPRKSEEHKREVERAYEAAYKANKKHARMLAGELVSMTPLEARERTRRLLGG